MDRPIDAYPAHMDKILLSKSLIDVVEMILHVPNI